MVQQDQEKIKEGRRIIDCLEEWLSTYLCSESDEKHCLYVENFGIMRLVGYTNGEAITKSNYFRNLEESEKSVFCKYFW